jgi:hypothetical protein
MPRPTKLTKKLRDLIVADIRAGNYAKIAAAANGIGQSTYFSWMKKGAKEKRGRFREFRELVQSAEATAERDMVIIVKRSALEGNSRSAFDFLERKYPDRWGKRERIEHTGKDGAPIEMEVKGDQILRDLQAKLAKIASNRKQAESGQS